MHAIPVEVGGSKASTAVAAGAAGAAATVGVPLAPFATDALGLVSTAVALVAAPDACVASALALSRVAESAVGVFDGVIRPCKTIYQERKKERVSIFRKAERKLTASSDTFLWWQHPQLRVRTSVWTSVIRFHSFCFVHACVQRQIAETLKLQNNSI